MTIHRFDFRTVMKCKIMKMILQGVRKNGISGPGDRRKNDARMRKNKEGDPSGPPSASVRNYGRGFPAGSRMFFSKIMSRVGVMISGSGTSQISVGRLSTSWMSRASPTGNGPSPV